MCCSSGCQKGCLFIGTLSSLLVVLYFFLVFYGSYSDDIEELEAVLLKNRTESEFNYHNHCLDPVEVRRNKMHGECAKWQDGFEDVRVEDLHRQAELTVRKKKYYNIDQNTMFVAFMAGTCVHLGVLIWLLTDCTRSNKERKRKRTALPVDQRNFSSSSSSSSSTKHGHHTHHHCD